MPFCADWIGLIISYDFGDLAAPDNLLLVNYVEPVTGTGVPWYTRQGEVILPRFSAEELINPTRLLGRLNRPGNVHADTSGFVVGVQ